MTFIQAVLCLWCPLSLCLHNQRIFIIQDQTFYFLHSVHFSSVQFSHSVVFDSLWPRKPQHTRPSCPSPNPGVHPNLCPLSRWCHPSISSSVVPFSSCPQSFPASGSLQMSQLFTSGGQRIGVSASTSVLPMSTQDWSPLGWTGWISLQSKGVRGHIRHYWQNGCMAPTTSPHPAGRVLGLRSLVLWFWLVLSFLQLS